MKWNFHAWLNISGVEFYDPQSTSSPNRIKFGSAISFRVLWVSSNFRSGTEVWIFMKTFNNLSIGLTLVLNRWFLELYAPSLGKSFNTVEQIICNDFNGKLIYVLWKIFIWETDAKFFLLLIKNAHLLKIFISLQSL